jgi:hypothetical protein
MNILYPKPMLDSEAERSMEVLQLPVSDSRFDAQLPNLRTLILLSSDSEHPTSSPSLTFEFLVKHSKLERIELKGCMVTFPGYTLPSPESSPNWLPNLTTLKVSPAMLNP